MKKIFTIFALLLSVVSLAQVDVAVKTVVKEEIKTFSKTLDSVLIVQKDTLGTFYIDTLLLPKDKIGLFEMNLTGLSTTVASAKKYAVIANINGAYSIVKNLNPITYSGYSGSKWDLLLINGLPVVRITSPIKTKWEYKRY